MSNVLWKSFNLCFSKFKCLPITTSTSPLSIQEHNEQDHNNSTPPPTINHPSAVPITTIDTEISNTTSAATSAATSSFDDYVMHDDSIPDFSSAFASDRFFFSTPGNSNSIFEQPRRLKDSGGVVSGVAVQKFTMDPYTDFRKSMQEMIDAHEWTDVKCSGEFLHELLLCYLTPNPKHTHKFIIDAFADIVVSLVQPPVSCRKTRHYRRRHRATQSALV
ncbi:transcription repressor OFP11-like [Primulina eburnea]|uniref:transcription repressor OFP11-like n=1 Tax=Primulina eburnea TaxID=1245227 RepID=UPI003C6BE755